MARNFMNDLVNLGKRLASDHMPRITQIQGSEQETQKIFSDEAYFGLTLHQLNLADGRNWTSEYDPLVYTSVNFIYGKERVTIPKVLGPSALKSMLPQNTEVPHGFLVQDVRIVGPVPYRGEQVGVTAVLFKVRTTDYAQRLLQLAEGLSDAIGYAGMGTVAKIGRSVVDSMQALFSMRDTEPVLGRHIEINSSVLNGLELHHSALVGAAGTETAGLKIAKNRLVTASDEQFTDADFLLYSLWVASERTVDSTLPFYPQVEKIYEAASSGEEGWTRAKALLVALYQQLMSSPDLTRHDAERLFEKYKAEAIIRREAIEKLALMGGKSKDPHGGYGDAVERNALNKRALELLAM